VGGWVVGVSSALEGGWVGAYLGWTYWRRTHMTGCGSCGGPPLDASKDQTEGEPQLDSLLDGADAAAVEAGHADAEAGVETRRCRSGRYRGSTN
jgi:hypothetical protein